MHKMLSQQLARNAGTIDWGHLNAEKVNLDPQSSGYEILGAEVEDFANLQPASSLPPPPSKGLKKQQKLQQQGMVVVLGCMLLSRVRLQMNADYDDVKINSSFPEYEAFEKLF